MALWGDDGPVASRAFVNHMELSKRLVPTIQTLLHEEDRTLAHVDAFAVSLGPGSFTGLRIGVATAKTLAQATGKPIIGVETMDALAATTEALRGAGTLVAVTLQARRGQYYVRWYGRPEQQQDRAIRAMSLDELREELALSEAPVVLIGDAPRREGLSGTVLPISDAIHFPNAMTMASLAHRRLLGGEADDLMALTPLYVGRSAAEEKRLAGAG